MSNLLTFLDGMVAGWGAALWRASWQGGVVLLAVWLLCRLRPKLSPHLRVWLWRIAFAKLLLGLVPLPHLGLPVAAPYSSLAGLTSAPPPPVSLPPVTAFIAPGPLDPPRVPFPSWLSALLLFWFAGLVWYGRQSLVSWREVRRVRARCRPMNSASLRADLAGACRAGGVRRLPDLLLGEVDGPLLLGIRRPAIVLPAALVGRLEAVEVRLMLAHEVAHLRRRDLPWNWLLLLAQCIFFFHPLVWLGRRGWTLAQEMSADALALEMARAAGVDYGRLLVKMAAPRAAYAALVAVGISESGGGLKQRVKALAHLAPATRRGLVLIGLGLIALALVIVVPWRIVARRGPAPALPTSKPHVTQVTGHVVTAGGKPVRGAMVVLVDRRGAEGKILAATTADAAGAFSFPRAECHAGEQPPAVATEVAGWGVAYHQIPYDGRAMEVTLPLPSELRVAFEDATGRPLRGVEVAVQQVLIHGAGSELPIPQDWRDRWTRKTDARGVATLPALPRGGQVRIAMEADQFAQLGRDSFIDLAKGAVTTVAPITVPAAATISGRVLFGPTRKPAAGIRVHAEDTAPFGYSFGDAVTDRQGRYRIARLRPAAYAVALQLQGAVAEDWTAVAHQAVELDEGQQATGVDFALIHGALITGRVFAKGTGQAIPGVAVAAYGPAHPEWTFPDLATSDADGRYRLRVPAGDQHVMQWGGLPAGYVALENRDVHVRLRDGQTRRVDFRFGGPLGPIHGRVVGPRGRSEPGAEVAVAPLAGKPSQGERIVRADARGEFDLPAGAVLLRARSGRAATLRLTTVTEGGNVTLELKDNALGAISGVVMDPAGHPLGGVSVELTLRVSDAKNNPTGREWRAGTATTGSDGAYLFPSLWPDQWYVVSASASPYVQVFGGDTALVKLKPGEHKERVNLRRWSQRPRHLPQAPRGVGVEAAFEREVAGEELAEGGEREG